MRRTQATIPTVTSWTLAYRIADEHGYAPVDLQEVHPRHADEAGFLYSWAGIPGTMGHPRFTVRVQLAQEA